MANPANPASTAAPSLPAKQVGVMAVVFLAAGVAVGYVLSSAQSPVAAPRAVAAATAATSSAVSMSNAHMPSADEMKHMADKQAAPLLEKLRSDPSNVDLLLQVGAIYHVTHQFHEAVGYYGRAAQAAPGNQAIRTKLASSLFRDGDADAAIVQLNQVLAADPKDLNALFDLGVIRLEGKGDAQGALAAWKQLLQSNPQLEASHKAVVEKLIADVTATLNDHRGMEGAARHGAGKPIEN
jgi:cytochrome c-type biogenesis protein CcmH/NrfG